MNTQLGLFSENAPIKEETMNNLSVTLLQKLLLETIENNPVLERYINTIVPALEREFSFIVIPIKIGT
jgi:hypothetical protein